MTDQTFEAALETLNSQHAETKSFYDNFKGYFKELDNNLKDYFKRSISQSKDYNKNQGDQFKKYAEAISQGLDRTTGQIKKSLESGKDKPVDIAKTIISSILPEKTKNLSTDDKIAEQKNFGPKTTFIDFSPKSAVFLKDIILQTTNRQEEANKRLDKYLKHSSDTLDAISENTSNKGGIFDTLGKLLLVGGAASLLIGLFWKDKIKPWLEQTLGVKLDFLDKFNGIVENIGKFFTLGGLKLSGVGLIGELSGKVLTSIGDFLEVALKGIFSEGLFKTFTVAGEEKIVGKTLFGKILPKIAGSLFKGVGAAAMKSIPVIGGIISLGFAINDFENNDPVSGTLNLVAGLLNFMELIPGAAIITGPLSIGVSVLNGILDYQAGGGTPEERTVKKLDILTGLAKRLYKIPIIGGLIESFVGLKTFAFGLYNGDDNEIKRGLEQMTKLPIFGLFPSIFLGFLDSDENVNNSNQISKLSIMEKLRKRICKTVISWFPESFQKDIAEAMGVDMGGNEILSPDRGMNDAQRTIKTINSNNIPIKEVFDKKTDMDLENKVKLLKQQYDEAKSWETKGFDENMLRQYGFDLHKLNKWGKPSSFSASRDYNKAYTSFMKERSKKIDEEKDFLDALNAATEQLKIYRDPSIHPHIDDQPNKDNPVNKTQTENSVTPVNDFKIIDNKNKTTYTSAPTDELYGIKPDGVFDKNQKMMINVLRDVHFSIKDLSKNIIDNIGATVNNVNVSGGGGTALAGGNKSPYGYNPVTAHRENTLYLLEKRRATSYA